MADVKPTVLAPNGCFQVIQAADTLLTPGAFTSTGAGLFNAKASFLGTAIDATPAAGEYIVRFGAEAGAHLVIDGTKIAAKANATTWGPLSLSPHGGDMFIGSAGANLTVYSGATFFEGDGYFPPGALFVNGELVWHQGNLDPSVAAITGGTISGVPITQNSRSAAYTLVLADSGKHLLHPSADTTARTFTIPANASVAFAIGTAVTFVNQSAAGVLTIAITTDTMRLAGAGTTGSRTLAANGIATAMKVTATEWIISGTGLT